MLGSRYETFFNVGNDFMKVTALMEVFLRNSACGIDISYSAFL